MDNLVSIIVPLYNGEECIERCLSSLIQQTYRNIEVVVVNDGSNDSSELVLKKIMYRDNRIRLINKKNGGQSSARNLGLQNIKGDYVFFVDCDDYIEKDMIAEMLEYGAVNDLDIVISGMIFDYLDEKYIQKINFSRNYFSKDFSDMADIIYESCKNGLLYSPCNKLYKTNLIKNNEINFIGGTEPIEDIVFNCEYLKKVKSIGVLKKAYYHYIKTDKETTVNRYFENLNTLSKVRNDKLRELFKKMNMNKQEHLKWLDLEYIWGKSNCISNIYNLNSNYTSRMKTKYIKDNLLLDKNLFEAINNVNNELDYFDKKILVNLLKLRSAFFIRKCYDILFYMRYKNKKFYFLLRKMANKKKGGKYAS